MCIVITAWTYIHVPTADLIFSKLKTKQKIFNLIKLKLCSRADEVIDVIINIENKHQGFFYSHTILLQFQKRLVLIL
jgi:hypothetical protein